MNDDEKTYSGLTRVAVGAVDSVCSRLFNLSNTYACCFVQLRIAKVKQTTTNGIDSTYIVNPPLKVLNRSFRRRSFRILPRRRQRGRIVYNIIL